MRLRAAGGGRGCAGRAYLRAAASADRPRGRMSVGPGCRQREIMLERVMCNFSLWVCVCGWPEGVCVCVCVCVRARTRTHTRTSRTLCEEGVQY